MWRAVPTFADSVRRRPLRPTRRSHRGSTGRGSAATASTPTQPEATLQQRGASPTVNDEGASKGFNRSAHQIARYAASSPAVAQVLANTPTYMIFDDHEVADDWNLNGRWVTSCLRSRVGPLHRPQRPAGLHADAGVGQRPRALHARTSRAASCSTPSRPPSRRARRPRRRRPPTSTCCSASTRRPTAQTEARALQLHRQGAGPQRRRARHAHPPRRQQPDARGAEPGHQPRRAAAGAAEHRHQRAADRRLAGARLRPGGHRAAGAAAGAADHRLQARPTTSARSRGSRPGDLDDPQLAAGCDDRVERGAEKYDREGWSANEPGFEALLARLATYPAVVLLSGDVHYGCTISLDRWVRNADPKRIVQCTSSAVEEHLQGAGRGDRPPRRQPAAGRGDPGRAPRLERDRRHATSSPDRSASAARPPGPPAQAPGARPERGVAEARRAIPPTKPPDWSWRLLAVVDTTTKRDRPADRARARRSSRPTRRPTTIPQHLRAVATVHQTRVTEGKPMLRRIVFDPNFGTVQFAGTGDARRVEHRIHTTDDGRQVQRCRGGPAAAARPPARADGHVRAAHRPPRRAAHAR